MNQGSDSLLPRRKIRTKLTYGTSTNETFRLRYSDGRRMPKIRISSGDVRRRDQTVYFYLIQLSYTAEAWKQQVEQTRNVTNRLDAVKQLIAHLGGSLANYHFFEDTASPDARAVVARDKFIGIGADDLIAVMAVPDHEAATAFSMAVSAETGVKNLSLTPIIPIAAA